MAVGAADGGSKQRRQRQHARLSRPRRPAVFGGAEQLADRDGDDQRRAHRRPHSSPLNSIKEVETDPTEQSLSGNTVNLEQQMINLGDVSRDYSMTANIRRAFHQLMLAALK